MENPDPAASIPPPAPRTPPKREGVTVIDPRIAKLTESRQELLSRIQFLKEDLQTWRAKLDTQVKVYREELAGLKTSLNTEVDQLRTEFQELRTTLQQQQEDVTASLRNLGDDSGEAEALKVLDNRNATDLILPKEENLKEEH